MNNWITSILILITSMMPGCKSENSENDASVNSGADHIQSSQEHLMVDTIATTDTLKSTPNFNLLTGDWVRSDGGYIISIRNIAPDGTFKAEYFNPKPIHVGRAQWEMEDNSLYLQVELQDVNYPGSLYTLEYLPATDRLSGIYFQAVEGATYEVLFNRKR